MKSGIHRKQKSKISKAPIIQMIAISLLIILIVLLGVFDLKLGSWYAPTQYLKVDTEGIHFYSGYTDSSPITWYLENEYRVEQGSLSASSLGYYSFPLPTASGDYHLYCTGQSGCDAGDWFHIDISTIPVSARNKEIIGLCGYGAYDVGIMCSGASYEFPFQYGSVNTPSKINCNTCSSRDVNSIIGYDTSAKLISAPPIPTSTPTATEQPTPTSIVESQPTSTPEVTAMGKPTQTESIVRTDSAKTPTEQTEKKGIPFISVVSTVFIIGLSYYIIKKTKKE